MGRVLGSPLKGWGCIAPWPVGSSVQNSFWEGGWIVPLAVGSSIHKSWGEGGVYWDFGWLLRVDNNTSLFLCSGAHRRRTVCYWASECVLDPPPCLPLRLPAYRLPDQAAANAAAAGSGPDSLTAAVAQALKVLQVLQPPGSPCAPALAPAAGPVQHTPDAQGWEALLSGAVRVLRAAEEEPLLLQNPAVAGVDTGFARQEFISGGQQVRVLLNRNHVWCVVIGMLEGSGSGFGLSA